MPNSGETQSADRSGLGRAALVRDDTGTGDPFYLYKGW